MPRPATTARQEAVRAFLDPRRIVAQDRQRSWHEDRYRLLGSVDGRAHVVVYHRTDAPFDWQDGCFAFPKEREPVQIFRHALEAQ